MTSYGPEFPATHPVWHLPAAVSFRDILIDAYERLVHQIQTLPTSRQEDAWRHLMSWSLSVRDSEHRQVQEFAPTIDELFMATAVQFLMLTFHADLPDVAKRSIPSFKDVLGELYKQSRLSRLERMTMAEKCAHMQHIVGQCMINYVVPTVEKNVTLPEFYTGDTCGDGDDSISTVIARNQRSEGIMERRFITQESERRDGRRDEMRDDRHNDARIDRRDERRDERRNDARIDRRDDARSERRDDARSERRDDARSERRDDARSEIGGGRKIDGDNLFGRGPLTAPLPDNVERAKIKRSVLTQLLD
jgi:hypothetical protein